MNPSPTIGGVAARIVQRSPASFVRFWTPGKATRFTCTNVLSAASVFGTRAQNCSRGPNKPESGAPESFSERLLAKSKGDVPELSG